MRKKLMGTLLAAALIASQAVTAMAAGSAGAAPDVVGDNADYYTISEITSDNVQEVFGDTASEEVANAVADFNNGNGTLQDVADAIGDVTGEEAEVKDVLEREDTEALTGFFDITADDAAKNEDGKYEVTLQVPNLAAYQNQDVVIMLVHYVTADGGRWELIPAEVDWENGTITAVFDSFSPVAVIAVANETTAGTDGTGTGGTTSSGTTTGSTTGNGAGTGTSPKTGVQSDWAIWLMAAAVLATAGTAAYRKAVR